MNEPIMNPFTTGHIMNRRAVLQRLGPGALATYWPISTAVLADEQPAGPLPARLTFPEEDFIEKCSIERDYEELDLYILKSLIRG